MTNIAMVVNVDTTSTKKGSRAFGAIQCRSEEMRSAELMSTNALATLSPAAFSRVLLTASNGHNPNSWTVATF